MTLQELPKSNYVQVIGDIQNGDIQVTTRVDHDNDDDGDVFQLPITNTQRDVEPMVVDQTGTDQVILPPSEFGSITPRQDFEPVPDPAFDIDDVYMEPTELDVDTTRDIVPRRGLNYDTDFSMVQSYQFGGHNAPLTLPPTNYEDQALVPVRTTTIHGTSRSEEPEARASKRYRI